MSCGGGRMRGYVAVLHRAAEQAHSCRKTLAVPCALQEEGLENEMLQQNVWKMGHLLWVRKCTGCSAEFKVPHAAFCLFGCGSTAGVVPQGNIGLCWVIRALAGGTQGTGLFGTLSVFSPR